MSTFSRFEYSGAGGIWIRYLAQMIKAVLLVKRFRREDSFLRKSARCGVAEENERQCYIQNINDKH